MDPVRFDRISKLFAERRLSRRQALATGAIATGAIAGAGALAATQLTLLNRVAGSLKPGGRLIYSVCTLTRSETTAVAEAFTAAHPELEPSPVFTDGAAAHAAGPGSASPAPATTFLWPHEINANGMAIAAWRKRETAK